jgi:D-alanyl-D-alanine carboxypeptidase/D-alanyl-D-alanine-endopeptidase (penicillin-binding protein 4)
VRRPRSLALVAVAMLCVFTMGAGAAVARMLPRRLALLRPPAVTARPLVTAGNVLGAADGAADSGHGATRAGISAALAPFVGNKVFGSQLGVLVADLSSGRVLYQQNAGVGFAPASTAKLATAVAALHVLGPTATFHTTVLTGPAPDSIVLVGGGDPTLTARRPPGIAYPQPATLQQLAAATASALKAKGRKIVRLSYDTSLYSGQGLAPGWPASYVTQGNVSVITPLEVDQGRLLPSGAPQDAQVGQNYLPRSPDPAADAARVFASLLRADGIAVTGTVTAGRAPAGAVTLATVSSPPLAEIVQLMLEQSNNVIAENLARHVAIATGQPATFKGGARAEEATLARLGIGSGVQLVDGSGLSPLDRITPAALVQLLRLASAASQPDLRPVITGLPVTGFSGTLGPGGSVFGTGPSSGYGMVRAKTGNLQTVAALAGIAYDKDGQLLAFAVMADKLSKNALGTAAPAMVSMSDALAACGCK